LGSHHHCCKHTSFLLGETMASTNDTMFDTPTKIKHGKSLLMVGKKTFFVQSVKAACLQVVSVYCIDCIWLIVDGFFVVVISIVAVCCVIDVFVNVDEVNAKEKTCFKQ
jgi:hypothetical protein